MSRVIVRGIGWLAGGEYGCISRGERSRLEGDPADAGSRKGLFTHPFKNFGRLDRLSRMTAAGISLALRDGAISYSPEQKQDIGIIGTGSAGSLATDLRFFRDYVESGRKLARGGLFIYTLPSSPLGEAAIHFGLLGPLFYLAAGNASPGVVFDAAEVLLLQDEAEAMLAGIAGEDAALYCLLMKDGGAPEQRLCDLSAARRIAAQGPFPDMVTAFQELKKEKDKS
ncbi:MAG TPA: hypothetical protein VN604_11860 [Nitrospirota bacterium]|nr:hypothetical protein [Nitrospirota bacterium]